MKVTARNEAASRNNKRLTINVLQDCFVPRKDPLLVVFYKNIGCLCGTRKFSQDLKYH